MIKNVRRQLGIFVFSLGGIFFVMQEIVAFSLLGAWTKNVNVRAWKGALGAWYVRESMVDDAVIGTALANISLGAGAYKSDGSMKKVLQLADTAGALIQVDILELVKNAKNPKDALAMHLKHSEKTLEEIDDTVEKLHADAAEYMAISQECLWEKNEGDRMFFDGLQANDEASLQEWLAQSLDASPCYITNRVKANASVHMATKIGMYRALLAKRKQFLEQKWDMIVEYKDLFEGNLLEQLLMIKQQLKQLNTIDATTLSTSLWWPSWWVFVNIFDPSRKISDLPNFSKLVPLDGFPTYKDPWNRKW